MILRAVRILLTLWENFDYASSECVLSKKKSTHDMEWRQEQGSAKRDPCMRQPRHAGEEEDGDNIME